MMFTQVHFQCRAQWQLNLYCFNRVSSVRHDIKKVLGMVLKIFSYTRRVWRLSIMPLGQLLLLWWLGFDGHVVPLLSRKEVNIYTQKHATSMWQWILGIYHLQSNWHAREQALSNNSWIVMWRIYKGNKTVQGSSAECWVMYLCPKHFPLALLSLAGAEPEAWSASSFRKSNSFSDSMHCFL